MGWGRGLLPVRARAASLKAAPGGCAPLSGQGLSQTQGRAFSGRLVLGGPLVRPSLSPGTVLHEAAGRSHPSPAGRDPVRRGAEQSVWHTSPRAPQPASGLCLAAPHRGTQPAAGLTGRGDLCLWCHVVSRWPFHVLRSPTRGRPCPHVSRGYTRFWVPTRGSCGERHPAGRAAVRTWRSPELPSGPKAAAE